LREDRKRDEQWNVAFLRWGENNSCENSRGIQYSDSCYTFKGGKFSICIFDYKPIVLYPFVPARVIIVILIHAFSTCFVTFPLSAKSRLFPTLCSTSLDGLVYNFF